MIQWKKYLLSDVIELIGGGTPKTSVPEYWNGKYPWLSVKDFNNDGRYVYSTEKSITEEGLKCSSTKLLQKDDIIISARGTVGEMAMIPFTMAFNQSCYGIRGRENINKIFLYYLIKDSIKKLKAITHGSVFDTITRDTFANIEVRVPDKLSQNKIAKLLSQIDDKIELNTKINNNLEQQAQAYFSHMFIENIDSTWYEGVLSDIGTVVAGGTPSKTKDEYYSEQGIAWITPKDLSIDKSKFISHGKIDISDLGLSKSSATRMPKGTVLFSSRAPIGYIAIAVNEITTNQGFKSIVPNENIGTAYIYFLMKYLLPTIEAMASGSTFKEISTVGMKSVPILIPDKYSLNKFNEFCNPIFKQQEILENENRRLAVIRDTLLPKLMSGELDVSNIDI